MAGERPDGPKVVGMPDTPGRPTQPGKPGGPDDSGGKPGSPDDPRDDGRNLPPPRFPRSNPKPGSPVPKPPASNPPGTPPGRPILPGKTPPKPIDIDGRTPPEKTNPDEQGNFDKGQVRDALFPNGMWSPTDQGGLGQFNPFNSGFGPRGGSSGGGIPGTRGGVRGNASTYDPEGIGQSNYGLGRTIGNRDAADGSSENLYNMTGVNAATHYNGKAKFGIVGGQGGYGSGMVAPEYTGPQFDSAKDVLKAYRQQRRRGERAGMAAPVGKPIGGGGGAPGGGNTGGGGTVGGPGGWNGKPGAPGGWGGQQGASGGGSDWSSMKPGAPAEAAGQTGGDSTGGAQQQALSNALGGSTPANGSPSTKPGMIWWNGVEIPNDPGYATPAARDDYAARMKQFQQGGLGGMLHRSMFRANVGGQMLDLVQSSGGNSNVYKVNGGSEDQLYYYDPQYGWRHMTGDEYKGYGDYNYYNPAQSQADMKAAGAQTNEFWANGGGNATAQWNPNRDAGYTGNLRRDKYGNVIR